MPTSYDGTLLDHLAEHIRYLSTASSFWFSVNSSYDHGCHLSKRMGMSPQDYEYLLVAANLAHFHQTRGFSIKILKWKLFLEGHQFAKTNCMGTVEIDTKNLDLNACSWLSYHLLLSSLVGIDVVRTPDLGRGGAHAGGVASRREEVHPRHTRARSPPPQSRYRRRRPAFHRRHVTIAYSVVVASPSRRRSP